MHNLRNNNESQLPMRASSTNSMRKLADSLCQRMHRADKALVLALAVIILVGLVPLTWYRPGQIIISGDDSGYWFNSPNTFFNDMNVWAASEGVGHVSRMPSLAALFLPMYILQSLSIANGVIQVMLYTILLVLSGLTMFYLLWTLIGKKPLAILVGCLFYMLCVIFVVNIISLVIIWMHAFLPLILALFTKLIQKRVTGEPSKKLFAAFVLSFSVFMSFLADSPPILIVALACLFVVFLYLSITLKFLEVIRETIVVMITTVLASLWWIVPFALTTLQVVSAPGLSISTGASLADADYRSSFLNWLWFMPAWKWQSMYYPYIDSWYTNPIVILATFIPIILVATGLLLNQKNKRLQYLFFVVVLIGIFIGKGTHPPFPELYNFLAAHIPMFDVLFREPENKFGVMIALFASVLIACTIDSLIKVVKRVPRLNGKIGAKIWPILLVALACSTIIITAGPIFSGEAVDTGYSAGPFTSQFKIPVYWDQANEFFANDSTDFRVLITPDSPFLYMGYNWGYWGADSVPLRLIQKPVLYSTYGYQLNAAGEALNMTYQTLENRDYSALDSLLSCLNIKYILIRNDLAVNFSVYPVTPINEIKNSLGNNTNVEFIQSFGLLDIYKNMKWSPAHFIASTTPLDGNTTDLLTKETLKQSSQVQLTSEKISASEYKIHINASQPVYLFFSEAYDSGWRVTSADVEWYSIPFTSNLATNHTAAFGFGNEWYINKTGSYEVTVTYTPESYFSYAIIASVLSFSIFAVSLGLHYYVKSRKKRLKISV